MPRTRRRRWGLCSGRFRPVVRLDLARCLLSSQRCTRCWGRGRCVGTNLRGRLLLVGHCGRRRRLRAPTGLRHPQRGSLAHPPVGAPSHGRPRRRRRYGSTGDRVSAATGGAHDGPRRTTRLLESLVTTFPPVPVRPAPRPAARMTTAPRAGIDHTDQKRADPARAPLGNRLPQRRPAGARCLQRAAEKGPHGTT